MRLCFGHFFPSSIKTLSDTSKTLNVLHNHMMRCRKCPAEVRESLERLRGTHDEERAKMKFGSQKAFFARIWDRLHGKDAPPKLKRKVPSVMPAPKQQSRQQQSRQQQQQHSRGTQDMKMPAAMMRGLPPQTSGPPQTQGLDALAQATSPAAKRQKIQ